MISTVYHRPLWQIYSSLISYSLEEAAEIFQGSVQALERRVMELFIPAGHILRRYEERLEYKNIQRILESAYRGHGGGKPPIECLKLFKLYLVSYIYPVESERELQRRASADMAIRWFAGFGLFENIPSHSTLCKFRYRIGRERFESCFEEILLQGREKELLEGREMIHDASKMEGRAIRVSGLEQAKRLAKAFFERFLGSASFPSEEGEDRDIVGNVCRIAASLVGYPLRETGSFLKDLNQLWMQEKRTFLERVSPCRLKDVKIKDTMKRMLSEMPHAVGDRDQVWARNS